MIAQGENEHISLSLLPVALVQFPLMAEYFKGFFPGCLHSANLFQASLAENGSISLQWHHTDYMWTVGRKAEIQPWRDDG